VTDTSSGVAIVVWRRWPQLQVLLLHRSVFGESFAGDWAWTTPGGARQPDEQSAATAARELFEETGLRLSCVPVRSRVAAAQAGIDVDVFAAEADADQLVRLSDEHDRYEWVEPDDLHRCLPTWVQEMYLEVLELAS
jgi:8-oxo-dGTP pyrophosphatase MutT (NUDIX family)